MQAFLFGHDNDRLGIVISLSSILLRHLGLAEHLFFVFSCSGQRELERIMIMSSGTSPRSKREPLPLFSARI